MVVTRCEPATVGDVVIQIGARDAQPMHCQDKTGPQPTHGNHPSDVSLPYCPSTDRHCSSSILAVYHHAGDENASKESKAFGMAWRELRFAAGNAIG